MTPKQQLHSALRLLFLVPCLIFGSIKAQNVLVAGATVGNGTYANLGAAFTALNGGAQTNATITVSITGNTTESSTATLNTNNWKSLTISPSGGAARSISGNVSTALINLYGTSNVLIDGLNTGGNSLIIDNAGTGATSTILFNNDCKSITVQNCTILGSSSSTGFGTLLFGAPSVTGTGNNVIRIKSCTIDASTGGNPINGIYSDGSVTAGKENKNDSILNTSIANFFSATLPSSGVSLDSGNTNWTISGCRFYQSATRTYTVANTHNAIKTRAGNNYAITNNIIGYAAAAGTGVYTMAGNVASLFIGIDISAGTTTASSVQGNTVSAISLATSSGFDTDNGVLCGIKASAGDINIGNITPNIIGGSTGANLFTATPGTTQGAVVGINVASTGTILIKNNIIGGLTSSSPTTTIGGNVHGISISSVATDLTIANNTIGNNTANNMRGGILATTIASSVVTGIILYTTPAATTITTNKIQNLSSYGTAANGYVRGIMTASAIGNTSPFTISGNTITKLTSNSTLTGAISAQVAAAGITISAGTNNIVSDNIISDISLTETSAVNSFSAGITHANATSTTIKNNEISNITNASTSTIATTPGIAAGIIIRSGTTAISVYNNMIALGAGSTDNTAFVGIFGNHGITPNPVDNIYHNTVNISGTASTGAQPSFCFMRGDFSSTAKTPTVNIKNNIFTNTRTGGTGSHFAIGNNYGATASATGWAKNASNNNLLNATNAATIGWWNAATTFANWKTTSVSDSASFSGYPITYVNPASDLHLNMGTTPNIIESTGQTIGSVTTDIDGEARPGPAGSTNGGALAPDLGADEFDGVIKDLIPPTISYSSLLTTCDTTNRSLTATIADAGSVYVTGVLQPRIYYRKNKNAWVSSQGTLSSGTATNGTWTFPILTAKVSGIAPGDTVSYFVIAQDVNGVIAANPSAGVVATDVNTVTSYPTTPNKYAINPTPSVLTTAPAAVCDSGKITLSATASAGTLNWYALNIGGVSLGTGPSFITPVIKTTATYYVAATNNGCTSTPRIAVVATVNHSAASTLTTTACDSLKWNGTVYKTSGTYKDTISTVKGCDSIITLNLTIHHSSTSSQTINACDSLRWNGKLYTISGTYKDIIKNKAGCDSVMTLHLTINHSSVSSQTINACGPYTWNGTVYNTSGVYKATIKNKAGCDSVMTLNLTITIVNATVTVNNNTITANSGAGSYQWINCITNSPIAGATNISYTPSNNGSYAVVETKNGCVDTSNCVPVIITGIIENGKDAFYFYPNPGTGLYTLALPQQAQIKIVSFTGKIVFDEQLSKGNHSIDLMNIANGVYLIQVYTNKTVEVFKLIKQE